jgi:TfoX/Sxy family transcriptional regulator of competence genes
VADAAELFDDVVAEFAGREGVDAGRMFASEGLKVDGRIFAMAVRGRLVVKLPRDRVGELVDAGSGERFDPGHGRLMKEWVSVPPSDSASWVGLAEEAYRFVGGR